MTVIAVLFILILVVLSIRERVHLYLFREKSWDSFPENKPSPLSQAVANLIGLAGGIYLSLILLFSFLEIELPERVYFGAIQVEPLAAISIALAIIQPFVLRLFALKRRS